MSKTRTSRPQVHLNTRTFEHVSGKVLARVRAHINECVYLQVRDRIDEKIFTPMVAAILPLRGKIIATVGDIFR